MQIKDIKIDDIRQGKNWKAQSPEDFWQQDNPLEDLSIVEATDFEPEDTIIYSVIVVYDNGEVKPLVQIKEVQYLDYGGDFCEIVNGKWQQVGLVPNPNAPIGTEYVANPLEKDESFISDDHDYRAYHREGFKKFAPNLK
jgi:hypothetical protein